MTPSADPANAATAETFVPDKLLDEGEVVLLAIKPSGWFVLLVSYPVLVAAALVAAGAYLAGGLFDSARSQQVVLMLAVAAGCLRVMFACFQWVGRLYVLTNKRVMRIRGVMRVDVFTCPLKQIGKVLPSATLLERLLRVGTLQFDISDSNRPQARWLHVARPAEVYETLLDALRRAG